RGDACSLPRALRHVLLADLTDADGAIHPATVYDLIANELALDDLSFTDPAFAAIFAEVGRLRTGSFPADREAFAVALEQDIQASLADERAALAMRGGSLEALESGEQQLQQKADERRAAAIDEFETDYVRQRLINSPDDAIRPIANELASERYILSRIYERQGGVETEHSQLRTLVPRAVNELRAAILRDLLKELNRRLAAVPPSDTAAAMEIMNQIVAYQDYQKRLVKVLGERIILPRG
ncbi:MAG: hypothetical protein K2L16_06265, partial [Muribaculaceae bacterium]|nr:hypothetical protein [Muribaculaceae bacterium]